MALESVTAEGGLEPAADAEARFSEWVREHAEPVRRFLARMLNSEADAEDVAQEVFCEMYRRRRGIRPEGNPRAYIFAAARRKAISLMRWRRVRRILHPLGEGHAEIPSEAAGARELEDRRRAERLVNDALAQLSEPKRAVIALRFFENLPYREIAEILGKPEATVRSKACRAERELRALLSKHGDLW